MFHFFHVLIFGGVLAHSVLAYSQDTEVRANYTGARALAMGGSQIAVVNDETALLVNPAALGKLRDSYGTIVDPEIDIGNNTYKMNNVKSISDPFDLEQVRDATAVTQDTYYHARGQLFPSFVAKNFGIGVLARKIMDAKRDSASSTMKVSYQDDVAIHLGFNVRFWDGRIKMGIVGKAISRIEINNTLNPQTSMALDKNASEGFGVGGDAGIILAAPIVWLPTLSIVGRDIGGTSFTGGSGLRLQSNTGAPPARVAPDADVAVAVFPIHSNNTRSTLTLEFQKIRDAVHATDKTRYYHAGYELNYADIFFVRAGMNQRYWTAGMELASERTQIQLTSYGADVGADGAPEEDRRYVLKFAFRF